MTAHGQEEFRVSMFIDCTIIPSSRTGGGSLNAGIFTERFPYIVQEAFCNGWKNGMAFQVSKGFSCRRHDLHILDETDILVRLTLEEPPDLTCYGDSAYPQMQRITCKIEGDKHSDTTLR